MFLFFFSFGSSFRLKSKSVRPHQVFFFAIMTWALDRPTIDSLDFFSPEIKLNSDVLT